MSTSKGPRILSAIGHIIKLDSPLDFQYSRCIYASGYSTSTRATPSRTPLDSRQKDLSNVTQTFATATLCPNQQHNPNLTSEQELANAKPYSELPTISFVSSIVGLVRSIFVGHEDAHWDTIKGFHKFGPIYRLKAGTFDIVWLKDVDAIEKMLRHDGKYPRRIPMVPWQEWREKNGHSMSILTV